MPMSKRGIDTNVLIYALDRNSDFYHKALQALESLGKSRMGVVCWQNLTEFYAIITDKRRVKNPLTPKIAIKEMETLLTKYSLTIIGPNIKTKEIWFNILKAKNIKGQIVHDMFLVATLLSNGIDTLITENTKDFVGINGFKATTIEKNNYLYPNTTLRP